MKRISQYDDKRNGWYLIGPDEAQKMLNFHTRNRQITQSKVNRIAKQISAGRWNANGESVVLDHDGQLFDGQHRLRAVIAADAAIQAYLVYLPSTASSGAFDTIDTGFNRTSADRLSLEGASNPKTAAAICRLALIHDRYGSIDPRSSEKGSNKYSEMKFEVHDIHEYYMKHRKRIDEATSAVHMYSNLLSGWARPATVGFIYYRASVYDQKKADAWLNGLATGENLSSNSPILIVRRRLQEEAVSRQITSPRNAAAIMVKSWNDFATGKTPERIVFSPEREDFPTFIGDAPQKERKSRAKKSDKGKAA